ncbi:hypothetical protein BS78_K290800 [Paspalum vaginatum]|uniref:Uncharacterized protein n=1 Tax=Paspalum vaginatum TaxID=158149 RepID=A0A9W7XDV4_9POAL|nr:hypothetical protein BS78_K290800 [Paspalum vaginatum]
MVVVEANPAAESVQVQEGASEESQGSKVQLSSGTAAKQRHASYLYKAPTSSKSKANPKVNKSIVEMLRKTPEVVDERRKGCSQPTIPARMKSKEEKDHVDMQWALWFYECGIRFNAAAARQFQVAVEATAQFGSGYKPPSPNQFGQPLLKEAMKLTSTMREDHERLWLHAYVRWMV